MPVKSATKSELDINYPLSWLGLCMLATLMYNFFNYVLNLRYLSNLAPLCLLIGSGSNFVCFLLKGYTIISGERW